MRMKAEHTLNPIYDENSKILILGSFPSVVSRTEKMYYANPSNRFWKVLEKLFAEEIKDKEAFLHAHHIALWDVIASCSIHASSDASIRDITYNDLSVITKKAPIQMIFTTGKKAASLYQKRYGKDAAMTPLPSTSSANAGMSLETLVYHYQVIREYL